MGVSRVMRLVFLAAQGFDGLFIYGCARVGSHAEADILMAMWMTLV